MAKATLHITGMHCTSCAFNIDGELEDTNGVKSANTNYAKQVSTVEFDENEVTPQDLIKVVEGLGYTATVS